MRPQRLLRLGDSALVLGRDTKIMGVLNATPDSFSDGGLYQDPGLAEERAIRMWKEGAHLIDVGAESSRPGARPVTAAEEMRRLRPILKRLARRLQIPVSVDTYKPEVARMALDEGVLLVNDITGLRAGGRMAKMVKRYKAGMVLMHMRGTPRSMQKDTRYRSLFGEIIRGLRRSVERALSAGLARENLLIDPGFGFGKSAEQNLELLAGLERFSVLKCGVLAGLSRKSFIGRYTGAPVGERLYGSLGAAAVAIARGAHVLRVHDVLAHRQMAGLVDRAAEMAQED